MTNHPNEMWVIDMWVTARVEVGGDRDQDTRKSTIIVSNEFTH
jgi:hypothetical protein